MQKARRRRGLLIAPGIILAVCRCALALNPSLAAGQYAHTAWTVREGFFKGLISSVVQTPDGYLWLGTEFGLSRFDGVRSIPWQPPAGEHLPDSFIRSLFVARDGRLWIGTAKGLASWKGGKLTVYDEFAGQGVLTLTEDREGTLWAGGGNPTGRLCAIQGSSTRCYGEDGIFGRQVSFLYEDCGGALWVGGVTGLWRWKPGRPKLYPMPDPAPGINGLIEGDDGALLISTRGGIKELAKWKSRVVSISGGTAVQARKAAAGSRWRPLDRDDGSRSHACTPGRIEPLARSDGLSGDLVESLFEDREGNVWVATRGGLDRFRDFAVPTISVKQGLSNAIVSSVLAAKDGSVWLGTLDGLDRWKDGQITIYRNQRGLPDRDREGAGVEVREITDSGLPDAETGALFQDDRGRIWVSTRRGVAYFENGRFISVKAVPDGTFVTSIAGDSAGNLWIAHSLAGLFHLDRERVIEQTPWNKLGSDHPVNSIFPDPRQGGLWLGFAQGKIAYFKNGQIRASYTGADGLGGGLVNGFQSDPDGALWVATEGGLSRIKTAAWPR